MEMDIDYMEALAARRVRTLGELDLLVKGRRSVICCIGFYKPISCSFIISMPGREILRAFNQGMFSYPFYFRPAERKAFVEQARETYGYPRFRETYTNNAAGTAVPVQQRKMGTGA